MSAMESSQTLLSAQIRFIDEQLTLIHLPLNEYSIYLQAILQLIYPAAGLDSRLDDGPVSNGNNGSDEEDYPRPLALGSQSHSFLNIAITPNEASIICSQALYHQTIEPLLPRLSGIGNISVSKEDYIAIAVEGAGLEAGQRVLELTTPLALAGIPIFFITTYFSDYVLVPVRSRPQVIAALEERGFVFQGDSPSSQTPTGTSMAMRHGSSRPGTSTATDANNATPSPTTPPPSNVAELQSRTFKLLRQRNIEPRVQADLRLVHTAAREPDDPNFRAGVTACLVHPPCFFSLTYTASEPPSLVIPRTTALRFFAAPPEPSDGSGRGQPPILLGVGDREDSLIPITLDLAPLPFEATGIVCGLASRLVNGDPLATDVECGADAAVEMSYLSTAQGATVLVEMKDIATAMRRLGMSDD